MCNADGRGKLYAIGLGPGDEGLLTVKAVEALRSSHTVLVPKARIKSQSVARDIVTRALGEDLPFKELIFPMSRNKEELQKHWNQAADEVLSLLNKGQTISFVTLGDVSLYSTFSYMEEAIKRRDRSFKAQLIPGISSIQLAAALFEQPLALGDESYGVFPLPADLDLLDKAVDLHDTVMIMKVGQRLEELSSWLESRDLLERSAFIRRAGFSDQYMVKGMENLDKKESGYLSLVMIKKGGLR